MRPTIRDVAMEAKCSITAVSLVLNGKGSNISAETQSRVFDAVKRLNYQPNKFASLLVTKKSNIIGLVIPDNCNPFFASVLKCAEHQADFAGYRIITGNSNNNASKDIAYINTFMSYCVDGILIAKASATIEDDDERLANLISSLSIPVVCIDRKIANLDIPVYAVNNTRGGCLATEHLIKMGHKRIGYYTYPLTISTAIQRLNGYRQALENAGIQYDPELVYEADYSFSESAPVLEYYEKRGVTAVFAHNDSLALELYKYARMAGRRIPDDLSIVGFDDSDYGAVVSPGLTTIHQPLEDLTKKAIEHLINEIDSGTSRLTDNQASEVVFEPSLVIRESVLKLE